MDADEVLRCLAEAESGRLRPELCGGRYAAVAYVPGGGDGGVGVLGEVSSVYEALDRLADDFGALDAEVIEELLQEFEDGEDLADEEAAGASGIHATSRRLLAMMVLDCMGPMDIVTEDHWSDFYLGTAPLLFPGARFVFLARAAPPHQDEAYAVLEIQPVGAPSPADRALMEAGDAAAVRATLAGGANVSALDERGMSPLHHAVAHRRPEVVAALLDAGADPALQAGFGNGSHFAALGAGQAVEAAAGEIEDAGHWRILRALVEAGAPVNAGDRVGVTLLDLAIATRPYPEEAVGFLCDHGARPATRARDPLAELLRGLPCYAADEMEILVNEVRFLLDSGADTEGALRVLIGSIGYSETEVPAGILLALVEEILRHGGRDTPDDKGRTALDQAEFWAGYSSRHANYVPVAERLRALR